MIINLYSSLLIELFSYDNFFFFFLGKECRDNISVNLNCVENVFQRVCVLNSGSRALVTVPTNMKFSKIFIKTESHGTIHTFKNYFATVFSVFSNK